MGSQTLEILRQGAWASLTGGWFYDPHQNLFCNTVHLYIWLFLLCLPFSVYLYYPGAACGWAVYCSLVALLFSCIKLLNHSLHHMYDTTECIVVPRDEPAPGERRDHNKPREEEGIELQPLGTCRLQLGKQNSDNESVTSIEYHKPDTSTIDLKVDVHRKNSSESSVEDSYAIAVDPTFDGNHSKPDYCPPQTDSAASQRAQCAVSRARSRPVHRRDNKNAKSRRRQGHERTKIEEISSEECARPDRGKSEEAIVLNTNDGASMKASRKLQESLQRRGSQNRDFFKEWLYLDGTEAGGEPYQSKFARQLSSDSRDNSEPSIGGGQSSPGKKKTASHRRRYMNESCTKSSIALAPSQPSNMRRNSNSTMSTIQLPLLNSTAQLVSHMRRHSNATDAGLRFLPTGSVELGAYMMEEGDGARSGKGKSKAKSKSSGVRRIKSAALEIGCPPPSVSNLSPHPNSVETIGGQVLKNPKNAVLPPPSKCLMRNPHLNLYPRGSGDAGEGCSYPYLNYGSEIVYPIAEISDEMQTSQKESDLDSVSGESYSDYDEENANMRHQFQGFDWDPDRSPDGNSSDSDYENNGSRSPLLDRADRPEVRVVRARTDRADLDSKRSFTCSDRLANKTQSVDAKPSDKVKGVRLKKLIKSDVQMAKVIDENDQVKAEQAVNINFKRKVENEEAGAAGGENLPCVPADYFDKASASSKDLLIEKSSVESNDSPFQRLTVEKAEGQAKKLWDQDISNSSNSLEASENKLAEGSDESDSKNPDTVKREPDDSNNDDNSSLYGIRWLFEEWVPEVPITPSVQECDPALTIIEEKAAEALGESSSNVQKNLGAIPKQMKNLTRSRGSSEKENKKRDSKHKDGKEGETQSDELILMDAVEAQAALVQGLECLFAATNANTVVMPTRDERPRSHRGERSTKARKRSIEEVAHQSTSTLLPTSMPLLAAFLNSRVDFPHLPICLPAVEGGANTAPVSNEVRTTAEDPQRFRPLMDRNHRNRVRKIKRSTRQRNNPPSQSSVDKEKEDKLNVDGNNSSNVHFATSFNDTTDGAIHCFMDEYGNWMSYTFDKNSTGRAVAHAQPIVPPEKDEKNPRVNQVKPLQTNENALEATASVGSCVSLESDANTGGEPSKKRGDSIDQSCNSSSNQGSNNPLLASNNNLSTLVPINTNPSSTRFYMFDGGTGTHHDQPRSPVAYVTDSLLEQIEAERQSRMGLPSMHINFLMNRNNNPPETTTSNVLQILPSTRSIEERLDLGIAANKFRLMDEIEKENPIKPKTYYKYRPLKCWEIKVRLDRLQLMALFDRNLTFKETFVSIILAIMVSILGSLILSLGFYKDIYAFWFCFIIAGSQYSLLKSVQPDSASPVHGFNKMVLFSRPVYFCLCTGILYAVHSQLESTAEEPHRTKRSDNESSGSMLLYGMVINERYFLYVIQEILSKFLLFFPMAFSLGLFPQVNTFLMYLLEQIDMHIFGGNATCSLTASIYCVTRSLAAIGVVYGFAYSGLIELRKSQHILFSIFCGLVVSIAYHLSRSASDYTLIWNLIKKHLLPPDLYIIHNPDCTVELEKGIPDTLSEKSAKKNNSESNISKQNSIGSSASKINFSSETNISKTQKRSQTSSVSSLKFDPRAGDALHSSSSLKVDPPTESIDQTKSKCENMEKGEEEMDDPLPRKLQATVNSRLKNDLIVCTFLALVVFGIHCTTVFTTLKPELLRVLWCIGGGLGWVLHYLMPQLRKQQPWLCLSSPVLPPAEHTRTEVGEPAKVMWFEKMYVYLCFMERNVLYPALFVAAVTQDAPHIVDKFGPALGALIVCVCTLKCLRNAYSDPDNQYLILVFAVLLFRLDFHWASETFLLDYALMAVIFNKMYEFLLKIQFVVTYIAPWQITWGSAFHAFAQPFSVPHSAMLFLQAALSAALSTPLNPILGSAIFMTSYVRPVKFWERDYNTKRVDQSNTRLSSHLERNLGADDNNLNSIFYEHLTRSLQHYLYGDLTLGRWGQVQQGDCFVLASDYLNCLVHIVEMGNGLVSFQLRGLEFRGTYCQQREVEAISEGPDNFNERCCIVGMLSLSTAWSLRWLAWQLSTARYVLEGYSVSDNSVVTMLQVFDFRKLLITYYVKSIIYYTMQSSKLDEWLSSPSLIEALKPAAERSFVDLDPIFNVNLDEDYDFRTSGITRASFCSVYLEWIAYCDNKREDALRRRGERLATRDSPLVTLCFALSLVGRRALGAASHNSVSSVEFFLYGLHALFKGDFRIMCARDEWVFTDMSLLHSVLAPAVRMALKLHQDHFMYPEEYCNNTALYLAISSHSRRLVICHEAAPAWRYNVLRGAPHLLALRHIMDEGNDDYKIIMLNKRQLMFRVIKLNRECVRGLWAGQQQELIYLRNRNPERGSIQNAKQALRNIINSSCDQPIGYPIYVSPLTTSYADTSPQLTNLIGGAVTMRAIKNKAAAVWRRIRRRCGEGCSSGSATCAADSMTAEAGVPARSTTPRHNNNLRLSHTSLAGTRGSLASAGKPTSSTLASLATLLREHSHDRTLHPHEEAATAYTTIRETSVERKRKAEEGVVRGGAEAVRAEGARGSARERDARHCARHSSKEARQAMVMRERWKEGGWRGRRERERARPQSFRLLSAQEREGQQLCDTYEMQALREHGGQMSSGGGWEGGGWREQPRRAVSAKLAPPRPPTPDSSLEDLTLNPSGLDLSLPDCKIIANRSAGARYPLHRHHSDVPVDGSDQAGLKRYIQESTSKDFAKLSKDIKHERESYRDLTGKYSELSKDSTLSLKEQAKYSDLSAKESGLRISGKDFGSKDHIKKDTIKSKEGQKEIKTKIKRSESAKTELKTNVSVGCKVIITEPDGVYNCINLGRRIDVQWPSEQQRERGGKNYWGNWVPLEGMDGQVVHKWTPNHRDLKLRSHVDKTILLVQIDDKFVPIAENCVQDLGDEV